MTFAKEAWPFVLPFAVLSAVLLLLRHPGWASAAAVVSILVLLFFRHPHRSFAGDPGVVIAAADGKVLAVDQVEDGEIGPGTHQRVITFLSVFNVHTQRAPVTGEVVSSALTRGPKVAAFRHDADRNERHLTVLRRPGGDLVGVRQMVGLVARRIVCYLEAGDRIERGETLGLIKFGSRVDLLVPESYRVAVEPGDVLRGGETPVAYPPSTTAAEAKP